MIKPEEIALAVSECAVDRKALDVVQLDLRDLTSFTDYFVICTGRSDRQVKAIHEAIVHGLRDGHGLRPARVEGVAEGTWVLIDFGDVVVHVFTQETREHYRLEALWGEAPALALSAAS